MGNKKRKNTTSFLAQGTILAAASLISRVIGLIYRMPLTAIIGDTGNDYYGSAYTIYNILLIISSYSLPLAVSKLVSAYLTGQKAQCLPHLKVRADFCAGVRNRCRGNSLFRSGFYYGYAA
jgi:stage V sporulation protein B